MHWHCRGEAAEVWQIYIVDNVTPIVWGHGWSEPLGNLGEGHPSTCRYAGASWQHPTQCPSQSNIWGYCHGPELSLQRPLAGSRLPVTTESQAPAGPHVATRIHNGHWAVSPLRLGLPEHLIQREAACAFIDGARDQDMKQHLMGGKRSLDETLN
jgi:hypothetical protein